MLIFIEKSIFGCKSKMYGVPGIDVSYITLFNNYRHCVRYWENIVIFTTKIVTQNKYDSFGGRR